MLKWPQVELTKLMSCVPHIFKTEDELGTRVSGSPLVRLLTETEIKNPPLFEENLTLNDSYEVER